ncbi:MAG: hypothetical protein ACOX88_06615 [Christensenellales bacterium]|jgi:hypothetical protein
MRKNFTKVLTVSLVLCSLFLCSLVLNTDTQASGAAQRDIEVTVAADAISNNLDLSDFSDKLKAKLHTVYGISMDKIHVNTVESEEVSRGFHLVCV